MMFLCFSITAILICGAHYYNYQIVCFLQVNFLLIKEQENETSRLGFFLWQRKHLSFVVMSSTTLKTPCVVCDKGSGLFKCEGCGQNFCTKHVTEHRQTLQHQLDKVVVEHDSIQQTIKENKIQNSPLIKYIDEWEETSIIKITQMSAEFRQIVSQLNDTHISKFLNEIFL